MGFFGRLLGAGSSAQTRYRDLDSSEVLGELLGGIVSRTGLRVSVEDALTMPGIAACVQVLEDDIAKVPAILYKKKGDGRRVPAEEHPAYRVIKESAAPWLSSFQFRRALAHNALTRGNGFARSIRDGSGQLERLQPLKHGHTQIRWTEDGEPVFDVAVSETITLRGLSWQDVVHMAYRGSTDRGKNGGIVGISPLDQNKETIALALAAERFAAKFFSNGARPSLVLEYDKRIPNDEVARRIRAGLERALGGVDNAHKIAITELGMKLRELSFKPTDSQLLETRKEQAVQFCTMFGVPPHKIGILDRATNNNIEHQGIDYVTGALSSLAESMQSALEIACLSVAERESGYYIELNLDGLMKGDIQSRYRAYAIGRQWGWLSADDVRARENMDDLPDGQGKEYLSPMNMTTPGGGKNEAEQDQGRPNGIVRPTAQDIGLYA